jgi:colanic acid/amylovoran biosynthesis glycosyltransferase
MDKSAVIHAIRGFLAPTETFVGNQIATLQRYTPLVLAHHRSPNREFDIENMYVINERGKGVGRTVGSLAYTATRALMPYDVAAAAQWLESFDPALWHFHFVVDAAFFLPLLKELRRPSVVSLYGYDISSFPQRLGGLGLRYIRRTFDQADLFLAMSEDMKRDAIRCGIPEEKIRIHYHGINTRRFRFDERSYDAKPCLNILCVGRLEPKKGQHHLVRAAAELRSQGVNAKVVIVGLGELENDLKETIHRENLRESVELVGYVPHLSERLVQYYRDADLFVHFSATQPDGDKEGIPGTIVEAMAAGLPIVTTRHAGIPEVITDGVHGILLNEYDTSGIAPAVRRLHEDMQFRRRLGTAAAQRALNELDVCAKTQALERIYDSLMQHSLTTNKTAARVAGPRDTMKHARDNGDATGRVEPTHRINGATSELKDSSLLSLAKTSWERIHALLPQRAKVFTSELVFRLSPNRPYVFFDSSVHPVQRLPRGVVTISIDFELAWGWAYAKGLSREDAIRIGLRERSQVPEILAQMDTYGIPCTWATVAHLFLEKCERNGNGLAHQGIVRTPHFENNYWKFSSGDWFQVDPCTDYKRDPAWYAPDLIEMILHAKAKHEIGCHSFSHGGFGEYCPNDAAESKIDACLEAMKSFGVTPKTWVFPGNDMGNFEALAKKGFRNVRAFPVSPVEISLPILRNDGMWGIHDSTCIDLEGEGWNFDERLTRLKKFVDKAAETHLAAHFWFHPSLPAPQMRSLLFPLLMYCAEQREKGMIDVLTVDDLVNATIAASNGEGAR